MTELAGEGFIELEIITATVYLSNRLGKESSVLVVVIMGLFLLLMTLTRSFITSRSSLFATSHVLLTVYPECQKHIAPHEFSRVLSCSELS